MPPADSAYHIKLNGGGFILVDSSYIRRSQQAFNPRFSTGDPNYGDLSYWQFIGQKDWDGGSGQVRFDSAAKLHESRGWDFSTGLPRLAGGNAAFTPGTANPTQKGLIWTQNAKLTHWGRVTTGGANKLIFTGEIVGGGGQDCVITALQAVGATQIGIDQINSRSCTVWQRQAQAGNTGGARYLGIIKNDGAWTIRFIDSAGTVELDYAPGTITWDPFLIIPVSQDVFLVVGEGPLNAASTDRHLFFKYVTLNNSAWTVASGVDSGSGDFPSRLVDSYAFDAAGTLYLAATESSAVLFDSDQGGSAVGLITSTDMVKTGGPVLSEIVRYNDFLVSAICAINGTIFLLGAQVDMVGGVTRFRNQVRQFPNTVVWEQDYYLTSTRPRGTIKAFTQDNRSEAFFVVRSSLNDYDSIMRLTDGGVVEEVGALQPASLKGGAAEDNTWMAIARVGRSFYAYDGASNLFRKYSSDQSVSRAPIGAKSTLVLSRFGGNTPLISKTPYSVTIELTEALTENTPLTVKVNGTEIGIVTSADGTEKEIVISADLTAKDFSITLEAPGSGTWPGELYQVSLRFVPTQFKKLAWGLSVRCDMNQQLLNGQREGKTAAEKMAEIVTAWKNNQPIPFIDVDGSSHQVLVTEFSERKPLIATNPNRRESIATLELLEV